MLVSQDSSDPRCVTTVNPPSGGSICVLVDGTKVQKGAAAGAMTIVILVDTSKVRGLVVTNTRLGH